ncbi:NADPH-dependent diflavin oxidoreductase 1 [Citrus sinensis]|nr:NADPH-dependent diflavin oxidoreductase 1 [Citrus sinensis]
MREEKRNKLLIFYASQTGNALDAAERIGRESERRGCPVVVRPVDDYDARCLPEEDTVIFVVSTTGQGDTPDSMKVFWRFLLQKSLSKQWLEGVRYAVFGLGDSGYQKFNFVAKKLDNRLLDLGATAVVERGLGDDQHPSGYEGALDPWMRSLWRRLHQIDPSFFPQGPDHVIEEMKLIDQPKVHITYHSIDNAASRLSNASDLEGIRMQLETARSMSAGKLSNYNNKAVCFLKMIKNQPLTKSGSGKDVHHFEFEFVSAAIEYEVGDVLEVLPSQDPAAVDTFIQRCNLDPDALITVMSYFATAEHEKERLQYFASPEGRDDLYKYNQKERRTVLEVLEDFPSVQMPFDWLVQLVPPLKTRAFSISSSPLAHPNQVHLTVSVVSWTTPYKRKRTGLCSAWLAGLDPQQGIYIPAWFQKGSLPRPPPSVPLILIGPGTGCAPFRGFVEERAIQSSSGPAAPIIFFFGCRNEDDFLYRELWLSHSLNDGVFPEAKGGGFYVAFSRKQPQKVYVQHKMLEQSQRIWNLLLSKASIYVAGSATKMPSDVWSTFEEIVSKEGEASRDSAANWLKALQRAGRYHVEAWS